MEEYKVFSEKKDLTLSDIKEKIDDGDIIPNPDYQRDYVYDDKKASLLVESVLVGIPIPTVYLCEEDDNTYTVIDGQQRITSFTRFLKNEFQLRGLKKMPECNKKYYKDLDKALQRKIKGSTLPVIEIKKESKELKYDIFARLNQGAVKLKPQELRNCIYRGPFNNLLNDIATTNKFIPILFGDENTRKCYQERILRFFALRDFLNYKNSMNQQMNDCMFKYQNADESTLATFKKQYNDVIDIAKQVLGNEAFMTIDRGTGKRINKFSAPVYDSIVVAFSYFSKHDIMAKADLIRADVEKLTENINYLDYTYAATGSKDRVQGRIQMIYDILKKHISASSKNRIFDPSIKDELWNDNYICSWCGNKILSKDDAEIDHIVPYDKGGETILENAQLLHRHCNREKLDSLSLVISPESIDDLDDSEEDDE